jgi:hypothetical protein
MSDRKTIAVCTRLLPTGDRDTACLIADEKTTVGDLNAWADKLCHGNTVCLRLELVDQYRGDNGKANYEVSRKGELNA